MLVDRNIWTDKSSVGRNSEEWINVKETNYKIPSTNN
jgi:hypothetical protein